jgi:hypothetical protein
LEFGFGVPLIQFEGLGSLDVGRLIARFSVGVKERSEGRNKVLVWVFACWKENMGVKIYNSMSRETGKTS